MQDFKNNFENLIYTMWRWKNNEMGLRFCLHDDVIKWKHFLCYRPLVRGIHRSPVVPLTKASDEALWCFLWSAPEQTVVQTIQTLVIWAAIARLWRHCNELCIFNRTRYAQMHHDHSWQYLVLHGRTTQKFPADVQSRRISLKSFFISWFSSLVQVMACSLVGTKPSPQQKLTYCQPDLSKQTSFEFELTHDYFSQENVFYKMAAILFGSQCVKC